MVGEILTFHSNDKLCSSLTPRILCYKHLAYKKADLSDSSWVCLYFCSTFLLLRLRSTSNQGTLDTTLLVLDFRGAWLYRIEPMLSFYNNLLFLKECTSRIGHSWHKAFLNLSISIDLVFHQIIWLTWISDIKGDRQLVTTTSKVWFLLWARTSTSY